MKNNTKSITRTGLLIALVLVAQFIGKMIPPIAAIFGPFNVGQLITGSLVNLILIVSGATMGILFGSIIGVTSSLLATLLGMGPIFPIITPAIAVSNVIIVMITAYFFRKAENSSNKTAVKITGIIIGAVVKCGFLWTVVPMLLKIIPEIKPPQVAMLTIMFSWPQAITALVGGLLALLTLPTIKKALQNR